MTCILVASLAQMALSGSGYEAWVAEEGTTAIKEWPGWAKALACKLTYLIPRGNQFFLGFCALVGFGLNLLDFMNEL